MPALLRPYYDGKSSMYSVMYFAAAADLGRQPVSYQRGALPDMRACCRAAQGARAAGARRAGRRAARARAASPGAAGPPGERPQAAARAHEGGPGRPCALPAPVPGARLEKRPARPTRRPPPPGGRRGLAAAVLALAPAAACLHRRTQRPRSSPQGLSGRFPWDRDVIPHCECQYGGRASPASAAVTATLVSSQPKCVMVAPRPGVGAHGLVGGLVPRAGPGPARAALCQGRVAAAGRNRRARRRQPAGRGRARAARRRRARRAAGQAQALRRRSRRAAPPMPGRCRSRDRVCCARSRRRQGGRGRRPALPGCACAACWLRRGEACSQVRLFRQWAGGRRYGKPHVDRLGMLLFFVKCAQVCAL